VVGERKILRGIATQIWGGVDYVPLGGKNAARQTGDPTKSQIPKVTRFKRTTISGILKFIQSKQGKREPY